MYTRHLKRNVREKMKKKKKQKQMKNNNKMSHTRLAVFSANVSE